MTDNVNSKWMIPMLTFMLGALFTAGGYTIAVKSNVDINTIRIADQHEALTNYVELTEEVIKINGQLVIINEQLVREIRAQRESP